MARFNHPGESFLAGLGQALPGGVQSFMESEQKRRETDEARRYEREKLRELMRSRFAAEEAEGRMGTAAEKFDVFSFLSQAPEEQQAAAQSLAGLLRDNPALERSQRMGGTKQMGTPMLSDPIRQLLRTQRLPKAKKEFAPPRPSTARQPDFTLRASRALAAATKSEGIEGMLKPAGLDRVMSAAKLMEQDLGRPLTAQEFSALKSLASGSGKPHG